MVRRRVIRWFGAIIAFIAVLLVLLVGFIYSGIYNVSALYPDSAPVAWMLGTISDHSVHRHATGIKTPSLDDPTMIQAGLRHYREDCIMCHGAPGIPIGEIGRGLNPKPPEMTEAAGDWMPCELFWITKNGVRMTGMPAWGKISSDKEIWQIVAFTQKLPSMTPAQYQKLSYIALGKKTK